ncbi:MAG TPA: hypothetical protein VNT76_07830, partial [Candidatus Binatus sp.]|nr:hypothetical protein [Candidatus Binatus sp.]
MFPDFVLQRRGDASIWIARQYADSHLAEMLHDADQLFADPSCQIIKDQTKIKVARLPMKMDGQAQMLFIKRYNMYSLRHQMASPFVQSGAFRSLRGAAILRAADIQTPVPVAAVENRRHFKLCKSFF